MELERILPDLVRLRAGGAAAVHAVLGEIPTLVDAGAPGGGPAIERELRAAGIRIERIVLTHGDPDHVGGADHLRTAFGAAVWAAVDERPMIDRTGWSGLPLRRRTLLRVFFRSAPPPTIDRWFEPGDDLGGLDVVPTPGHTLGHVALEWRGWLLAGDAFVSGNPCRESPGIFTLDRVGARRSIETLVGRGLTGLSSSHGRPVDDAGQRLSELISRWD